MLIIARVLIIIKFTTQIIPHLLNRHYSLGLDNNNQLHDHLASQAICNYINIIHALYSMTMNKSFLLHRFISLLINT